MRAVFPEIDVYVINLVRRADRLAGCASQIKTLPFRPYAVFAARDEPDNPSMGCALSHAHCLSTFLFKSTSPFVLILEDDFEFIDFESITIKVKEILAARSEWDVVLLAHNQAIPVGVTSVSGLQRVINSQTASAYIVQRRFVPILMAQFCNAAEGLLRSKALPEPNKTFAVHSYALDIYWHALQKDFNFVAIYPPLVRQRVSYSDIQKKDVDYGV